MPDPSPAPAIDYCIRDHALMRFQVRVSLKMRAKMLAEMPFQPGMNILEVGTTPDSSFPDQNFFSKSAKALGCQVSVTSIEDCSQMARENGFRWVPLGDLLKNESSERFDCVVSAAVLEHVEGTPGKLEHLRFLNRCSKRWVVITIPNRGHWFEVHTKLPFIHWFPNPLYRRLLRLLGLAVWAEPSHMDLLWGSEFRQLVQTAFAGCSIHFKSFRFLGATSNVMAVIEKPA
jgi:hypothetical protein